MTQWAVGLILFLSSFFACQMQNGDFKSLNVEDFESYIQNDAVQRLDVRTPAEYSEGTFPKPLILMSWTILLRRWWGYCLHKNVR